MSSSLLAGAQLLKKIKNGKLLRLTLFQSVMISFALMVVAAVASVLWIFKVEEGRQEQMLAAQHQVMGKHVEQLLEHWTAQVGREALAASEFRFAESRLLLPSIAARLGAKRVMLVTPNGDSIAEHQTAGDTNMASSVVSMLTARAMEYGRASGSLASNTTSRRPPLHVVAAKVRDSQTSEVQVLLAVFSLDLNTLNDAVSITGKKIMSVSLREANPKEIGKESAKNSADEIVLIKSLNANLVATLQAEILESDMLMLVAPGLAIGVVSSLLATAFLVSAVRRQRDRLSLLRKVVDNYAAGKAVKLTPSSQKDGIGKLAMSLRNLLDISNQREQKLLRIAHRDAETGLPNRSLYQERIDLLLQDTRQSLESFSILALRVDGLTAALDVLSPDSRSRLLKDLANRLLRCVRRGGEAGADNDQLCENATVARLDEDMFCILLPNSDVHKGQALAVAVIQNVTHQFLLEERSISLRPFIGLATYPAHGVAGMVLHRAALSALSDAQRSEQNLLIFGQAVKVPTTRRDAVPKVASHRDEFDFDWDKIAG